MSEIDQIAAARAALELVTNENEELLEHFKDVTEKLDALDKMPPGIKAVQFRQLEQAGAFKFNGADIRHFTHQSKKPLTPSQFVRRTNRRMQNTSTLIDAFMERKGFDGGKELQKQLNLLAKEVVDESDQKAVVRFKQKVEGLRETEGFAHYQKVRDSFIKGDEELKAEADIMAAKENAADGEIMAESRGEELEEIKRKMEKGEISPEEAQKKVEEIELAAAQSGNDAAKQDSQDKEAAENPSN